MFNTTTKQYTAAGHDGSFDWIVEGADAARISKEVANEWADQVIANVKEADIIKMSEAAEEMTFPKMGYSTTHVYRSLDDYIDQKTTEIEADLDAEKSAIVAFLLSQ